MSEFDDFREDENANETEPAEETPQLFYGSSDEFVRERLIHMYARRVGPGNASFRWAADWWNYPEALARIDALWRAWEHLRLDAATGSSVWWIEHADHHMPILMSTEGPFAKSEDANKAGEPLPYTVPPAGLFPDMRLG
ncbi:DUF4913 domain-containing protein [Cryobacterium sp. GrIS_2_6]|uniref:DUF4913 domain-containing protein n=1 Tax=Cryobacterium sp. GrIS_2_6 TaxID=3162785 RepID=UPI002E084EDB|nr:hypothetical protein [Cryobacterium psychrotolerans]